MARKCEEYPKMGFGPSGHCGGYFNRFSSRGRNPFLGFFLRFRAGDPKSILPRHTSSQFHARIFTFCHSPVLECGGLSYHSNIPTFPSLPLRLFYFLVQLHCIELSCTYLLCTGAPSGILSLEGKECLLG